MKRRTTREILDMIAVLWIILSTGSMYFCIFNMKMSMIILDIIAIAYLFLDITGGKPQCRTVIYIIMFLMINSMLNFQYIQLSDDIIILLMRLFALMIIFSNMTAKIFKTNYCKILLALCILSLICFGISEMGFTLPGEKEFWFKNKYYICTVYHTVGRWTKFHRNAGIFWESPAFAIFINIGILFALVGNDFFAQKKKTWYFIVYSITLFTTKSSTAYLAYLICIIAIFFNRKKNDILDLNEKAKNSKGQRILFVLVLLVIVAVFIYLEATTHIMERKIISHQGSYGTRSNDTLMALKLAFERPLTGYGLFNNYTYEALYKLGVTDNSNFFSSSFMYFGIMAIAYYVLLFNRLKKLYDCSKLSYLLILAAYIVFLNTELIGVMTLFLGFLFPFKPEQKKVKKVS